MANKIRCPGCSQDHNWLRVLPCKHQLCMGCITTQCPQCSQPIPCPQSGRRGSNLPFVFAGTLACDLCTKVKDADDFWYCEQCVDLMCSACCLRVHSKDFQEHKIHEWGDSLCPLLHCSSALRQCSDMADPMGNQAQLKELIKLVYRRLTSMMKEQGPSVAAVASSLERAYSLEGISGAEASPGTAEKLENHLQVAKQALVLTNMMRERDQVGLKLRGFKRSPDAVAEILFNELDFGDTPAGSEIQKPVQEVQPQKAKPSELVQPKRSFPVEPAARESVAQAAASTPLLSKAFHIPTQGTEVSSVVFGSNRFLALLTESSVQVWSIEDLKEDGNPIYVGSVIRRASSQTFVTAAISEWGDGLFVLRKTKDQWDVLIFELSNCSWLKTMSIEQRTNISSVCIGATDSAVAYLILNSTDYTGSMTGQFYRLSQVPPHYKNEFRLTKLQMNSMAYKRVSAKCIGKLRHLVAAMEADQPCVHMFHWNGKVLQNIQQTIQLVSPSPLLSVCFRADEDVLFISSQDRFQWWKFYEGVGKKTFDFGIKAGFVSNLGILNGLIVGAVDQTDQGCFRFLFFQWEGMVWVSCSD